MFLNRITLKITFLGTGTSQGIPVIGSNHPVCNSQNHKDKRLRVSVLIEWNDNAFVIDCGPDFRQQMLRQKIKTLDDEIYCEVYGSISYDEDAYLYTQRARIYQNLNKIPEAFADYAKAIKLSPMSYSFRGEFNLKLERYVTFW